MPRRVVLSPDHYRTIQTYHAHLGEVAVEGVDYIERYRLFDLEICVEDVDWPRVEGEPASTEGT